MVIEVRKVAAELSVACVRAVIQAECQTRVSRWCGPETFPEGV